MGRKKKGDSAIDNQVRNRNNVTPSKAEMIEACLRSRDREGQPPARVARLNERLKELGHKEQ